MGLFPVLLSLKSLCCSKPALDISLLPFLPHLSPPSLSQTLSGNERALQLSRPQIWRPSVLRAEGKKGSGWFLQALCHQRSSPSAKVRLEDGGLPSTQPRPPTLWKFGANLGTLPEKLPQHLIYNLGKNKTNMGGTESLLTVWLQVANFKEKKFLKNDINQLESCLH